jgi:hypothetical protein
MSINSTVRFAEKSIKLSECFFSTHCSTVRSAEKSIKTFLVRVAPRKKCAQKVGMISPKLIDVYVHR